MSQVKSVGGVVSTDDDDKEAVAIVDKMLMSMQQR